MDIVELQKNMQNNETSPKIDVLLVTALAEERDALLRIVNPTTQENIDGSLIVFRGSISSKKHGKSLQIAIMMLSQMGNVEAGNSTSKAIGQLHPDYIFMVGIAGGVRGKINLGDLLISTDIIYYEPAKLTPEGSQIRQRSIPADSAIIRCAQNYIDTGWKELIGIAPPDHSRENEFPEIHFSPIAVGEKVIADGSQIECLLRINPNIAGVEMESYGVATAANNDLSRPRFISIRAICDYADSTKNDQWHSYACAAAAAYAIGFLQEGMLSSVSSFFCNQISRVDCVPIVAFRHFSLELVSKQSVVDAIRQKYQQTSPTDLFLDESKFYKKERLSYPSKAIRLQKDIPKLLDGLHEKNPEARVAYFGLAHIPLLFHLGYCLTNKRRMEFFEFNRFTGEWSPINQDCSNGLEVYLEGIPKLPSKDNGDIILRISISNTVELSEVKPIVTSPIASIHLFITPTHRDVITSSQQLSYIGEKFRVAMDAIHELFPNREYTHIFYAGPVSLAVYLGQLIHHGMDRDVVVYNYYPKDSPRYSWGLQITEDPGKSQLIQVNHSLANGE